MLKNFWFKNTIKNKINESFFNQNISALSDFKNQNIDILGNLKIECHPLEYSLNNKLNKNVFFFIDFYTDEDDLEKIFINLERKNKQEQIKKLTILCQNTNKKFNYFSSQYRKKSSFLNIIL